MITGEELAAYAAGEADPDLVARIESALPGDAELATRLARIREVDGELAAWPLPAFPAEAADRLRAAVDTELATQAEAAGSTATDPTTASGAGTTGATTTSPPSASPATSRPGGAAAAGGVSAGPSTGERVRQWLSGLVDGMGAPRLAGVAAALVVVVGVGAVLSSGTFLSGQDDSDMSADAGQPFEELDNGGGGFASSGTETAAAGDDAAEEAMTEEAMTEAMSEEAQGDPTMAESEAAGPQSESAPAGAARDVVLIDDGRVVASIADIDAPDLRDRLEPLVPRQSEGPTATAEQDLRPTESTSGSPRPMADGRVDGRDVEAARACQGDLGSVIVAEVVTLAPERDAVLYVQEDRVVVVALDDCTRLGVIRG